MYLKSIRDVGVGTYIVSILFKYLFRINRKSDIVFHYTSRVSYPDRISFVGDLGISAARISFLAGSCAYIQARNGIVVDSSALIAPGMKLISANHNAMERNKFDTSTPIEIKANVWIGCNVVVLPGVSIGENTIVGAGSVVTKSLPDNVVAAGNPCRVIKRL